MDKQTILQQFEFFREAEGSFRAEIARASTYACVKEDTNLFHEGDRCDDLALVGTGLIRIFKTGESGREINLYHVQSGEGCVVNMLSVFTGDTKLVRDAALKVFSEVFAADDFTVKPLP